MKKSFLLAIFALALTAAPAAAAPASGVEGTVLDTTCASSCEAECPPPPVCRAAVPCPVPGRPQIVCPLTRSAVAPLVCTEVGCPGPPVVRYPRYEGNAARVIIRRAGSAQVLKKAVVVDGSFEARLAPGRYVLRAHVAEPCWTGTRQVVEVGGGEIVPTVLEVSNGCVAHPDGRTAAVP